MAKYYDNSELRNLSMQDIRNIKKNAHALQRHSFFQEAGAMEVHGTLIKIVFLEKLPGFKGGKYKVEVRGNVNRSHIAKSNRDLYNYLVGIMIKAHNKRFGYEGNW